MSAEHFANFMAQDWSAVQREHPDFNQARQSELEKVLNRCAADNNYNLASRETESEDFKWFSVCLTNNVGSSIVLGKSETVRRGLLGWSF